MGASVFTLHTVKNDHKDKSSLLHTSCWMLIFVHLFVCFFYKYVCVPRIVLSVAMVIDREETCNMDPKTITVM